MSGLTSPPPIDVHPEESPRWRKRDSILWGIVGAIHVVGLLMPVRLPTASGQRWGTKWMWVELLQLHGDIPSSAFGLRKATSAPYLVAGQLIDIVHATVLLSAEYVLALAFLAFFLETWRRFARTATQLLVVVGVGLSMYVGLAYPFLLRRTPGSVQLGSVVNLGLWTWILSFAVGGVASLLLDRWRSSEVRQRRTAERRATAEMVTEVRLESPRHSS